ncbi:MAG: hypothetical protein N2045_07160 [Fimbriimonadales bacterium]|nr:hypothetical protein [Armatimonadota bacterium]MCX7687732.1 hypothetical protein [Fimbriimonadales bacterium]
MQQDIRSRIHALISAMMLSVVATTAGWSQSLTWLGTLGGIESQARGVSADGAVVVGWAKNASSHNRVFRWTQAGGMENLNLTYASQLSPGSYLEHAEAISPDGRYTLGKGYNAATRRWEAFLLDTGPRVPRTTAMWTATAVWTTPICLPCCSRLARVAKGLCLSQRHNLFQAGNRSVPDESLRG